MAAAQWDIVGTAHEIPVELGESFKITSTSESYVLKLAPAEEPNSVTDLITAAMLHVAAVGNVEVQRVVRTLDGASVARFTDADGALRQAWMTTFLDGQILRSMEPDRSLRQRLGATLARLAAALETFEHPAAARDLPWDLRQAGRMRKMLAELAPSARTARLNDCLERFDELVLPKLKSLQTQVVHNDLSRDNVVVMANGGIGVIDFGDVVKTQRINDLAIAMADQLGAGAERLAGAADVAQGYIEITPIISEELAILYDLVRTRVATRIVGGTWRATRFPGNREYLARNVDRQWEVFLSLPETPTSAAATCIADLERRISR